ncbi:MAG: cadmium-translocating P-type ATPase [Clostridia bacterium]|nr:cadmium-translocating P-type ATPase [Clostridia bacterium]
MENTKQYRLKIEGMRCAACSAAAERALKGTEGVTDCAVNLALATGEVTGDETLNIQSAISALGKLGYKATLLQDDETAVTQTKDYRPFEVFIGLFFGALVMYIGMSHMIHLPIPAFLDMHKNPLGFALSQLIFCLPVLVVGRRFLTNGVKRLVTLHPNMDSLVALGTGSAFLYSLYHTLLILGGKPEMAETLYFESAAVVLALILLGKFLEEKSKNRAKDAIASLAKLIPQTCTVLRDGERVIVKSSEVLMDEIVLCAAGEKLAVDGVVIEGSGDVDESMLTGESLPVFKEEGSKVSGGTILKDGFLKIRTTGAGGATAAAQIMRLVAEAQQKKAPISRMADKISAVFVPAVLAIALLSAVIWAFLGKEAGYVLQIFVSVLVVACPCSLGLATPIAVMVASGRGAKLGILFRGGDTVEHLSQITMALFDKTGTVTEGALKVNTLLSVPGVTEKEWLPYAIGAEHGSVHPVAKALLSFSTEKGISVPMAETVTTRAGKGVVATVEGKTVLAGTHRLMEENQVDCSQLADAPAGMASVYVAINGKLMGIIGFSDTVKATSREAVKRLAAMHIESAMITGDNRFAAEFAAKETGITRVLSEVLPADKAKEAERLKDEGYKTAMIGDGINDAPALAAAHVGVCVFGGTDVAAEVAGVLLMRNDLLAFTDAVALARYAMKIIRQNLFWAFIYNTIGIPLAAGVLSHWGILLTPALAGTMMALSSFCVVTNSLRITRFIPQKKFKK